MSFFKEFKEDFDEAMDGLVPDADSEGFGDEDDELITNAFDSADFSAKLDALNDELADTSAGLFESTALDDGTAGADTPSESVTDDLFEESKAPEELAQEPVFEETPVIEEEPAAEQEPVFEEEPAQGLSFDNVMSTDADDTYNTEGSTVETAVEAEIKEDAMSDVEELVEDTTDNPVSFDNGPVKFEPEEPIDVDKIFSETEYDDEMAVITKGMTIHGDLEAIGSIEIKGTITGNVKTSGKLVISGKVKGNSTAKEFFADSANINGEITTDGSAKVGNGSVIVGNISSSSAVVAGAVKGDLDVHGPVIIDTTAVIVGNIKSKSVQINNGAVIQGFCSQEYADVDVDNLFGPEE